ncbi:non-reducing end alpha-L-arabinofuranosidase family hydrolase [Streptomyces sp. NBC_00237]|uniref:non-reducing end alpha-L-arabinofuranosidase family hydrolase n=1 Tax=Streptomyces sp. NBC_00237 TaxID=2975687 RepID=UPI00225031B1|nr:non-reducing end alpha-L-arabinofuranosidase family hydrolase [Streptomyces sp. NBC_00237]MCX5206314.1 non-reducing end alpha-L-arabinofuranosidase family hydrolase [Streptomyces sp. NBC_00237]
MDRRTTVIGMVTALMAGSLAVIGTPTAQAATGDVAGASSADGAAITQWARHDGTNQQFQFVDSGDGYHRLKARHSGKLLDLSGWSTADNAAVNQWSDHGATASLPSKFQWSSSGPLAGPKPDAQHPEAWAVKDFSVIRYDNQWQVYATTATPAGWNLVHYAFDDWSQAASAPHTYLDTTAVGKGYRAAPQVFYFAPQNLWYMVYQTPWPTYSTSTNPADPRSWSTPRTLMSEEPDIVKENKGDGTWIDFWVICDSANCHLFFSDDNGHVYRAQTSLGNFPNGFGNTELILSDTKENLFEATNVYKVAGSDQYLLIQEAAGPGWRRYFRSFTSTGLTGPWTPTSGLHDDPFAGQSNVTFPGGAWSQDISHGEMIRASNDQTLTIDPCRLQFVYQGVDPRANGDDGYIKMPYRMGLLTQTNSPY